MKNQILVIGWRFLSRVMSDVCSAGILSLCITSSVMASSVSEMYRTKAVFDLSDGNFTSALELLEKAVAADASDMHAVYYRGIAYSRLSHYAQAITDLATASAAGATYKNLDFELGYAYYHAKQLPQAQAPLKSTCEKQPGHAQSWYYLGLVYYEMGALNDALEPLRKAGELDDKLDPTTAYLRGKSLIRLGRIAEGEEVLRIAISNYPDSMYTGPSRYLLGEGGKTAEPVRFELVIGGGYDSNVGLFADPDNPNVADIDSGEDFRAQIGVGVQADVWELDGTSLKGAYQFFQSLHDSLNQFDLQRHAVALDLRHSIRANTWGISYQYSEAFLDNEDYLQVHEFSPYAVIGHGEKRLSVVQAIWRDSNYFPDVTEPNRDGDTWGGDYTHYWLLDDQPRYYITLRGASVDAVDRDFRYDRAGLVVGLQQPLQSWLIKSRLGVDYRRYQDTSPRRRDRHWEGNVTLVYPLQEKLDFEISATRIVNPSTISGNDYKRSLFFISFRWQS